MSNINDFKIVNGLLEKYSGSDEHVTIPDGVTSIGEGAFRGCEQLQFLVIPNGVTSIGNSAFSRCEQLQSVVIPDSVTSIGERAFCGCEQLQSVVVPNSVTSIGDSAFSECYHLQSIVIPDSVTSIGDSAFYRCEQLQSVVIPDSVTSIGKWAFSICKQLQSVVIPNSVTSIGEKAFYECKQLQSVVIPNSVTSIGEEAFSGCKSLANSDGFVIIRNKLFGYYGSATDVTIPDGVTSIGKETFRGCEQLQSVVIPNSVTSIGERAFYECKQLQSVVIPDSVTSIGEGTFRGCEQLQSIVIPNGVTSIGNSAFRGCKQLQSIVIPDSVTSIGDSAFYECKQLQFVVIPDSVTSIGEGAFNRCEQLQSVVLSKNVATLESYIFDDCINLKSITMPCSKMQINSKAIPNYASLIFTDMIFTTADPLDATLIKYNLYLTAEDMAYIWLFQNGKKWKDLVKRKLPNPVEILEWFVKIYKDNPSLPEPKEKDIAAFLADYEEELDETSLRTFIEEFRKLFSDMAESLEKLEIFSNLDNRANAPVHPIESFVNECYLTPATHRETAAKVVTKGIPYADGSGTSSKKAIVVFLEQYIEKWYSHSYVTSGEYGDRRDLESIYSFEAPAAADKIAEALDRTALSIFLSSLVQSTSYRNFLLPFACWAEESDVAYIIKEISSKKKGNSKDRYWAKNMTEALYLSDTEAAVNFMEKSKDCNLERYLSIRGMTVQEYRDKHSLPSWNMTADRLIKSSCSQLVYKVTEDLGLQAIDGEKELRSVTAKAYPEASAEYKALKKEVADFYKQRVAYIRNIYITAEKITVAHWEETYHSNPILLPVTEKVIWSDAAGETFMVVDGAIRTVDGASYEPKDFVQIAHVLDLTANQIAAWQNYLQEKSKKLLIEQVWEPISAIDNTDLFRGVVLSKDERNEFKRTLNRKSITVSSKRDYSEFNHREYTYEYSDTGDLKVGSSLTIDYTANDDTGEIELRNFYRSTKKMTRELNTILFELGRVCVKSAIRQDAIHILSEILSAGYTAAQVAEFIRLAQDCGNTQATAVLLEHQQNHFADLDPMAEFTLD